MQYKITILIFFSSFVIWSQTDFSDQWEDFYSYNNVKEFINTDTQIIALSDNAVFIFDKLSNEIEKISSVNGLSGETTSTIYYDEYLNRILIGYENGLVEIIDSDRSIFVKPDILNFNILGSKRLNQITANGTDLYIATPFGIVVFDIDAIEFKDTYFIGDASSEIYINEIEIYNDYIYAVTENGMYKADINEPFLIDFNNWSHSFTGNFSNIAVFDSQLYLSKSNSLFRLETNNTLTLVSSQLQEIKDIKASENFLTLTTQNYIRVYNTALSLTYQTSSINNENYNFNAHTAFATDNEVFIGTDEYGILNSNLSDIHSFNEIHPEGPISNQVFSISVLNNNLWVVYGGYNGAYGPLWIRKGASHFNGEHWTNIPYASDAITERDLVHVNIDPSHENRVYISSWNSGMLIIENDEVTTHWNHLNSGLENLYNDPEKN